MFLKLKKKETTRGLSSLMASNLGVAKIFGGIVAPEIGPERFRDF